MDDSIPSSGKNDEPSMLGACSCRLPPPKQDSVGGQNPCPCPRPHSHARGRHQTPGAIPEAIPGPTRPRRQPREVQPRIPSDEEAGWLLTQQLPYQQGKVSRWSQSGGTIGARLPNTGQSLIETRKCGGARCTHRRCQRTAGWIGCAIPRWTSKPVLPAGNGVAIVSSHIAASTYAGAESNVARGCRS